MASASKTKTPEQQEAEEALASEERLVLVKQAGFAHAAKWNKAFFGSGLQKGLLDLIENNPRTTSLM